MTSPQSSAPANGPGRRLLPDADLRCRSGRHVWLDATARERCCDPAWLKVLVLRREWGTASTAGVQYAGPSAVPGLDYAWKRVRA